MKNRIIYLLSTTVVILLAVIFLPVIAGKSLINWSSLKSAIANQQEEAPLPEFSSIGPSKPATVYRWKEHDNTWQFSSTPPPAGTHYETVIIDADHTHAVLSDPAPPEAKTTQTKRAPADSPSIPSVYSPAEIEHILKKAKDAQKLINEHQKELDAAFSDNQIK